MELCPIHRSGNSARSITAEAILNHDGLRNFTAYSGGSNRNQKLLVLLWDSNVEVSSAAPSRPKPKPLP